MAIAIRLRSTCEQLLDFAQVVVARGIVQVPILRGVGAVRVLVDLVRLAAALAGTHPRDP